MITIPLQFANLNQRRYDKIFVDCPKCAKVAVVFGTQLYPECQTIPAIVYCLSCSYRKNVTDNPDEWHGFVSAHSKYKIRCSHCGHSPVQYASWMDYRDESLLKKEWLPGLKLPSHIRQTCGICHQDFLLEVEWLRHQKHDTYRDPFFGLTLHLIVDCLGKKLWVYNETHLHELIEYISAKNRPPSQYYIAATFPFLPSWVKNKKNRTKVIACLKRLQQKLEIIGA